jgi:NAD(P)-dependent dehydrogenase (short-subunit alcohol dehydrogenase family)
VLEVKPSLLIVGAAQESLGAAIAKEAYQAYDYADVVTAGISGDEQIKLDVNNRAQVHERLVELRPDAVVCTVGINEPAGVHTEHLDLRMFDAFRVNCLGPLAVLQEFVGSPVRPERITATKKFVAISSNSAHIPRRVSMAYCASKAALSMALRVAARELAEKGIQVWGYEPGLLAGTPMTEKVAEHFGQGTEPGQFRMHRMSGVPPQGIPVFDLAAQICFDLANFSPARNGVMVPFDADEI